MEKKDDTSTVVEKEQQTDQALDESALDEVSGGAIGSSHSRGSGSSHYSSS